MRPDAAGRATARPMTCRTGSAAGLLLLGLLGPLAGCVAPPSDRIILLPGSEGRPTGGVSVRTPQGEQVLDQPLAQAHVSRDGAIAPGTAQAEEVRARYGELLAARPPRARVWTVYFETGSNRMTAGSEAALAEIRQALADYPGGELVLTGHTDSVGRAEDNDRLSLQRAQALKDRLVQGGFAAGRIAVAGRGEREPLVATPDETAEPRNRRVDIKLR